MSYPGIFGFLSGSSLFCICWAISRSRESLSLSSAADWATCTVNRAEPKQDKLIKPDNAFAETSEEMANVIIGWPTKLTLAPDMAQRVLNQLQQQIKPIAPRGLDLLDSLPKPAIAIPPWDQVW